MTRHRPAIAVLALALAGILLSAGPRTAPALVDDALIRMLESGYGGLARERGVRLAALLERVRESDVRSKARAINRFFNEFTYRTDVSLWGEEDHWATPLEFLGRHGGDCEDFVISKYFALRAVGVADSEMALTYVIATRDRLPHMVLGVRERPGEPHVYLDNTRDEILPAAERGDFVIVYGFNAATSRTGGARPAAPVTADGAPRVGSAKMARLLSSLRAQSTRAAAAARPDGSADSATSPTAFGRSPPP